jgi:hypothetical protein
MSPSLFKQAHRLSMCALHACIPLDRCAPPKASQKLCLPCTARQARWRSPDICPTHCADDSAAAASPACMRGHPRPSECPASNSIPTVKDSALCDQLAGVGPLPTPPGIRRCTEPCAQQGGSSRRICGAGRIGAQGSKQRGLYCIAWQGHLFVRQRAVWKTTGAGAQGVSSLLSWRAPPRRGGCARGSGA